MEIKDLQPKQGNVDIVAEISEVEEAREFQKFGNSGKVANAIIRDGSGEVKLTLWNEQVDQVKKGDKIHITNGYTNEWQGEKQLTTGKFGTLEVLESNNNPDTPTASEDGNQASDVEERVGE